MKMPQAVNGLAADERRALLQWLTQQGPFWEDSRKHTPEDWLECGGVIVTDTAVGEAGWCCLNGMERRLVSLTPSKWQFSPLQVYLIWDESTRKSVDVFNHWELDDIELVLQNVPLLPESWSQLQAFAADQCDRLTFAPDAFTPLSGQPFFAAAAQRVLFLLNILNRLHSCFDTNLRRTAEGHEIYRSYFTGRREGGGGALFSDSSEDEKNRFASELTFKHPDDSTKTIFCPWHAKIQTPPMRVHFSWPIRANEPLYIVYVGPKLTKRQ